MVEVAHSAEALGPNRASLPSMFPPGCEAVATSCAPALDSRGLPDVSRTMTPIEAASHTVNMIVNTA